MNTLLLPSFKAVALSDSVLDLDGAAEQQEISRALKRRLFIGRVGPASGSSAIDVKEENHWT